MRCYRCGTWNDPALSPSGRIPPKDWDPVVCVGCSTICVIDSVTPSGTRAPATEDWDAWHADRRLARWVRLRRPAEEQTQERTQTT